MTQQPFDFDRDASRSSGRRRGATMGSTLRERYRELLIARGPLSDHEAGAALNVLSTTAGARRLEWMAAVPGCIESAGRARAEFASGRGTSRTRWRWALGASTSHEVSA